MITVTEHAREVLKGYECPEGTALRLDPANGRRLDGLLARLGFGEPRGDDQVIDHEGEELLRINRTVSEELNGSEICVVSTLEGPGLDLKRPPARLAAPRRLLGSNSPLRRSACEALAPTSEGVRDLRAQREGGRMPTPTTEDRFTVEIVWNESIEAYVARVPDIPELAAWDETQEDALKKVRKAIRANIEIAQEHGDPVPEPSD